VLASLDRFKGGVVEFELPGLDGPGYVIARGFGEHDDPDAPRQQLIEHMTITNPVYLHPRGFVFAPVTTRCTLAVAADSPWLGGKMLIQEADGAAIEHHRVVPGDITTSVPATARIRLTHPDREPRQFYLALENRKVQRLLQYLHNGEFRDDYPGLAAGQVPPAAFRLDDMREALSSVVIPI
jgi:hypothetical protein